MNLLLCEGMSCCALYRVFQRRENLFKMISSSFFVPFGKSWAADCFIISSCLDFSALEFACLFSAPQCFYTCSPHHPLISMLLFPLFLSSLLAALCVADGRPWLHQGALPHWEAAGAAGGAAGWWEGGGGAGRPDRGAQRGGRVHPEVRPQLDRHPHSDGWGRSTTLLQLIYIFLWFSGLFCVRAAHDLFTDIHLLKVLNS